MKLEQAYPAIAKATEILVLDNGILNRFSLPLEQIINKVLSNLVGFAAEEVLETVNSELAALSPDDLEEACCGDCQSAVMQALTPNAGYALEFIFNNMQG